eukprot:2435963-Alexandrium_andersonii.AAC.1
MSASLVGSEMCIRDRWDAGRRRCHDRNWGYKFLAEMKDIARGDLDLATYLRTRKRRWVPRGDLVV